MKIGVLTGGGDCPGLNAVVRAVVKTARNDFGWQVVGFLDGFEGVIHSRTVNLTPREVSGIIGRGGTILGASNRANPFKYLSRKNGKDAWTDLSKASMTNVKKLGLAALVVIGGDGSLSIADRFHDLGLPVVGVPKTIDNDLSATDVTFGFDTALHTATDAIDKLTTTAESHHRVMILEVMGRYAGWIALETGLAGGADVILIPEIPFQTGSICAKVRARESEGKKFSIVVVAEGAVPRSGELTVSRMVKNSTDPVRLGGIGQKIGNAIESALNMETRVTVLGHIQRGGSPSPFDRILGSRFGRAAVHLISKKGFGRMVALRNGSIIAVPLKKALGVLRRVPPKGELVRTARSLGICFGD